MSVDEREEREGDEERPGEVEERPEDDDAEFEAHGGWGGAARPEP